MSDVRMPSPAEGVEEATIARWLKRDGEAVAAGDELLEIETDKVTIVHTADTSGIMKIAVPEGSSVPVGTVIGHLVAVAHADEATLQAPVDSAPSVAEAEAEPEAEAPAPERTAAPVGAATSRSASAGARATPLARLIASRRGIDLTAIEGTGPYGLITRTDVSGEGSTPAAPVTSNRVTGNGRSRAAGGSRRPEPTIESLSRLQKVIARRMVEAKTTVPEFQVETEAVVDALFALREEIKQLGDVPVPSVNDFVIKAAAVALREHPRVNGSYREDGFLLHSDVNVGFAVAAEDALIVPTIRNADTLSLLEISAEARRLADRARAGSFTTEDITGGTFTVSNLGMFGMTAMVPIINVPEAAILGVAAARDVPAIGADGSLRSRSLMTLTLTCDHRILYGADAARFLADVRTLLEQPLRLMLGVTSGS